MTPRTALPAVIGPRWYVASVAVGREAFAGNNLTRQGMLSFCPWRLRSIRHARQLRTERAALFPGYVFVHLNLAQDPWRMVNATPGIRQLIAVGDVPTPIRSGVVETLIASCDSDGIVHFISDFALGGRVRMLAGPFADQLGVLERSDKNASIRLLLSMMNRQVSLEIGLPAAAKIPAPLPRLQFGSDRRQLD
ncbi:transcription termination/antitermination protein NusG [Rhodoligotrophos appendicifer]|uniref:transcription termination/antitermination protein NusG n=1 Tax=Rhodoligotrophos appendicifer TaxID=987056 RepID=UPI0014793482|nr:transcription termination/antitermination NusG family protein [Rhodoligotrophos appendicifer]